MNNRKVIFIGGSSGFIGGHLVRKLKNEGHEVIGADLVRPKYESPHKFYPYDLSDQNMVKEIFSNHNISDVYMLQCLMGGMGYIGSEEHSYDIMIGSSLSAANVIQASTQWGIKKLFYSGSACCYNMNLQSKESECLSLSEDMAYCAQPDLVYGWQKLFTEQMCDSARVKGLDVRVARFHNIFGIEGTYCGGKEKAPAALARKVAMANDGDEIEVWGDGSQRRSFLYIDECLEAVSRLMDSDFSYPLNIGSDESVTINQLAQMAIDISGKKLTIKNVESPFVGVQCRNSDNTLIEKTLGWKPTQKLEVGMRKLYSWIESEVKSKK